jgi:hypothetical protein
MNFTKQGFKELANKGFYVCRIKGTYKGKEHTEYSVQKDLSETERTVVCLLNNEAARILRNEGIMMTKNAEKEAVWLNRPESMDFSGNQMSEPLKITFHQ